jgi:hypothetical protein
MVNNLFHRAYWHNTGIGTDLTRAMDDTDVHSGLVKGGETGADDIAGPGQYGDMARGLEDERRD